MWHSASFALHMMRLDESGLSFYMFLCHRRRYLDIPLPIRLDNLLKNRERAHDVRLVVWMDSVIPNTVVYKI